MGAAIRPSAHPDEDSDRRPVEPRSGDPSERELARSLLLQNLRSARRLAADAVPSWWVAEDNTMGRR